MTDTSSPPALESEIAQTMSLDIIRYSQVWEDHRILTEALQIAEGDDVLSIASAGCNVLALILAGAKSVTALDMSVPQISLVELKLAGLKVLDHPQFVSFLGAAAQTVPRLDLYNKLRPQLSASAQAFWDKNTDAIGSGVIHCGRLDKYLRLFVDKYLADIWPAGAAQRLVDAGSVAEQQRLFEAECESEEFRRRVLWFADREMMARTGRDEAQLKYVEAADVAEQFLQRFRRGLTIIPTAGNFYVEYHLLGAYHDLKAGPPYLRPEHYDSLRANSKRVRLVTAELEPYLQNQPVGSFNKANLSDVFEYMSSDASDAFFEVLASRLRPGGRVAHWNLLVPRTVPTHLAPRMVPLEKLSRKLHTIDRTWMYQSFHVDELIAQ